MSNIALNTQLRPLRSLLDDASIAEICINQPGEVWVDRRGEFSRVEIPELDMAHLLRLVKLFGTFTHQEVGSTSPLLSAKTPEGYRIQAVLSPVCPNGKITLSIRKPSLLQFSLQDYADKGLLKGGKKSGAGDHLVKKLFIEAGESQDPQAWADFFQAAVKQRKNMLISGGTFTGKTTFMNALLNDVPIHERLIMIEDVEELCPPHPNQVRLLYSRNDQGVASVDAVRLFEATLRLRPDRVLLGELRGEEAFAFLRASRSGHKGSITSVHADSPDEAFEQIVLMCLQSGLRMEKSDLMDFITGVIDVVVQWCYEEGERFIEGVWFEGNYQALV